MGIFSLEMSKEQLVNRLLAMQSHVEAQKIRTGDMTESDVKLVVLYHKSSKKSISKHQQCNSRTNEIKDLLQFGKEIKVFFELAI